VPYVTVVKNCEEAYHQKVGLEFLIVYGQIRVTTEAMKVVFTWSKGSVEVPVTHPMRPYISLSP